MKNKEIIRQELLRRKICEHFSKCPKSKVAILRAESEGVKLHWQVVREKNKYNITEVSSHRRIFSMSEDPDPVNDDGTSSRGAPPISPGQMPDVPTAKLRPNRPGEPLNPGSPKQVQPPTPQAMEPDKPVDRTAANNYMAGTQDMLKWSPSGGPDNEFNKAFAQNKGDLGATAQQMPPDAFHRAFNHLGVKSPAELMKNPAKMKQAQNFFAKQNPAMNPDLYRQQAGPTKRISPTQYHAGPNREDEALQVESSPEFVNISRSFTDAMSPPFDHIQLSNALNKINQLISKLADAEEINQAGSMIGALTGLVDTTTQGGGSSLTASKKTLGRLIKELGDSESRKKELREADPDVGLETEEPPEEAAPAQPPPPQKNMEELAVAEALAGQTITKAEIDVSGNGAVLSLHLVNATQPAIFVWEEDPGDLTFVFQQVPYFLKKGSDKK